MFFINIAYPWTLLIALILTVGFTYIAKEAKKSKVALLPLIAYVLLLIMHIIQYIFKLPIPYENVSLVLAQCVVVDAIMLYATYISYLWINAIEAKSKNNMMKD